MPEKLSAVTRGKKSSWEKSPRILVVDDHDALRMAVVDLLNAEGFTAIPAKNAAEALADLAEETPDLILCDIMMPDVDGYQLHEQIQSRENWCNIPFIFLTAMGAKKDVRAAKSRGCDDYLVKPVDPEDLIAAIKGKLVLTERRQDAAAEKITEFRKRVINTLSHEFRTPLVAIHTGAELLLNEKELQGTGRVRKLIEAIYRGGNRLERLVNDFMTLQQIQSGAARRAIERLRCKRDLQSIVQNAVDNFMEIHSNCDNADFPTLHLTFSPQGSTWIYVFEQQVMDAIIRLLQNAEKFGPPEQPIEVSLDSDAEYAWVTIRDHGPGLPGEIMQNACQSFVQIDRDKLEQQGCGLGLTIAQHHTSINGGTLSFATPEDGGLAVTLSFPLLRADPLVEESHSGDQIYGSRTSTP